MRRQLCRNRFSPGRKELGRGQESEGKQHEIPLLIALAIVIVAADYARRFIRMDYREDENAFHRCVDDIRVSGNDLLNFINNVLDPARSESGKAALG